MILGNKVREKERYDALINKINYYQSQIDKCVKLLMKYYEPETKKKEKFLDLNTLKIQRFKNTRVCTNVGDKPKR